MAAISSMRASAISHQRDQQDDAEPERESGAGHEIVGLPEREDRRKPGADHVGGDRKRDSLAECGIAARQDRQRQQQAEQNGETGELPVVGVIDKPGPAELGVPRGIEHAPIHADAAFVGLPWLVEGLDDVVVDAIGLGARDEIAEHRRLLDAAGIGVEHVVAGARPAEFGDHDAFAGVIARSLS